MASSGRINETHLQQALDSALLQANKKLEEEAAGYQVSAVKGKALAAKEPIFLEIAQENEKTPIGITHFAHLTKNFDSAPFKETARTVEELATSILKAVEIYEKAKNQPDVIITSAGTPFFKNGLNIEIREGILFIEGKQINFNETPLEARRLCGEEGLKFAIAENGDFEIINPVDHREGKGIFFNKDSGTLYRK